jgi:ribosomal protein S18 acetylase RimI-like enzyme
MARHDILKQREAPPPVSLRIARREDAPRLAMVGRATFLESYAGTLPVEDIVSHCETKHSPEVYEAWLTDGRSVCWLLEAAHGGAPVGYLVLSTPDVPVKDPDPNDWEIKRIYLLSRFQGSGNGRRMMEACARYAKASGCARLLLGVYSRNDLALKFYARMGFEKVGERMFRVGGSDYYDYILGRAP